jgi:hypothetical protein
MKISTENTAKLTTLRETVASWLDATVKATGELDALRTEEARRNDEIAAIESGVKFDDVRGVDSYETKKSQLWFLRSKIERLEQANIPKLEELKRRMQGVHEVLGPALEPAWRELVVEIARKMLPYTGEWGLALKNACHTKKPLEFAHFYMLRRYGLGVGDISEARHVLKILDAVLAGKDIMPFHVEELPAEIPYYFPWERQS